MKHDDLIARLRDAEAGTHYPLEDLRALLEDAATALQRVADLHQPWADWPELCVECERPLPCATLRALEGDE